MNGVTVLMIIALMISIVNFIGLFLVMMHLGDMDTTLKSYSNLVRELLNETLEMQRFTLSEQKKMIEIVTREANT